MSDLNLNMPDLSDSDSDSHKDTSERHKSKKAKRSASPNRFTHQETHSMTAISQQQDAWKEFMKKNEGFVTPSSNTQAGSSHEQASDDASTSMATPASWQNMMKHSQTSSAEIPSPTDANTGENRQGSPQHDLTPHPAVEFNQRKELSEIIDDLKALKHIKAFKFDRIKNQAKGNEYTKDLNSNVSDDLEKIIRWGTIKQYNSLEDQPRERQKAEKEADEAKDRVYSRLIGKLPLDKAELTLDKKDALGGVFGRPFELNLDKVSSEDLKNAYYDLITRRSTYVSEAKGEIDRMKNTTVLGERLRNECVQISKMLGQIKDWPEYFRGQKGVVSNKSKLPKSDAAPSTDPMAALEAWSIARPRIQKLIDNPEMYNGVKPFLRKITAADRYKPKPSIADQNNPSTTEEKEQ